MIPDGTYLVGDAGYPSNVSILVQYPSVLSPANEWFNFIQSLTRIVVEQAFGRLKNWFQILLQSQNARPLQAKNNTFSCIILHNILNRRGSLYLQDWDERTHHELLYGEVPQGHKNGNRGQDRQTNLEYPQVSMWTRQDIIRDYLYTP
jgi:hypothetical protein